MTKLTLQCPDVMYQLQKKYGQSKSLTLKLKVKDYLDVIPWPNVYTRHGNSHQNDDFKFGPLTIIAEKCISEKLCLELDCQGSFGWKMVDELILSTCFCLAKWALLVTADCVRWHFVMDRHAHIHTYTHTDIHTYIHAHIQTYTHTIYDSIQPFNSSVETV